MKIILFLFILFTLNSSAQEMSCDEKVEKLLIAKIKSTNSKDLVPYFSEVDQKWGYMHRKSKKIITKPILNEPYFFKPSIRFYYSFETNKERNGCTGKVTGSIEKYRIESIENAQYEAYESDHGGQEKVRYSNMVNDSIAGFQVSKDGNLSYFNSKFYDQENDKPLISRVFFFKDKYYGIVQTRKETSYYYSVINQDGFEYSEFQNLQNYPHLKQIYSHDMDIWFLVKGDEGKYIYKSLLENKVGDDVLDYSTIYGENQSQSLGYVIFSVNKMKGLYDLTSMTWKIKPSTSNDFYYVFYASAEPLLYSYEKSEYSSQSTGIISNETIAQNRANCHIYIQSSTNDFYDLDLKKYKPK